MLATLMHAAWCVCSTRVARYTIYSADDIDFDLGLLQQTLFKKIAFIENQIVARSKSNFTPQQLEEFSETFKHFDKDNSNTLKRDEFKAALASEGTAVKVHTVVVCICAAASVCADLPQTLLSRVNAHLRRTTSLSASSSRCRAEATRLHSSR